MLKVATQEDFNNFLMSNKKNIPIVLRAMFSKKDADLLKQNWREYAKANGYDENIEHLHNSAKQRLEKEEKRKSKY